MAEQVLLAKGVLSFRPFFDAAAFKVHLPAILMALGLLRPLAHVRHTLTDATLCFSPSVICRHHWAALY